MKGSQDSGVSKNLQKIQRMQDVGETADPQEPPLESALLKDKEKILEPEAHSSLQGTGQQLAEPSASKSTLEHSKMAVSGSSPVSELSDPHRAVTEKLKQSPADQPKPLMKDEIMNTIGSSVEEHLHSKALATEKPKEISNKALAATSAAAPMTISDSSEARLENNTQVPQATGTSKHGASDNASMKTSSPLAFNKVEVDVAEPMEIDGQEADVSKAPADDAPQKQCKQLAECIRESEEYGQRRATRILARSF